VTDDDRKPLVIYHGGCYDGFTAAWIVDRYRGPHEWFSGRYGDPPPDCTGRDVVMVDFSYPREEMEAMDGEARTFMVLDHHKTAQEACDGLDFCTFDMERSGAGLAWDFFGDGPRPKWVDCIEDRDLWRFHLPETKNLHAYIASFPMTIGAWDRLAKTPTDAMVEGGESIRRYIDTYLEKAAVERRVVEIDGNAVVALNIPYQNASEAADVLLCYEPDCAYSMGYFQRADGRWQFSLRSRGDFDVSEVAKLHGGGGHAAASGFDMAELPGELR